MKFYNACYWINNIIWSFIWQLRGNILYFKRNINLVFMHIYNTVCCKLFVLYIFFHEFQFYLIFVIIIFIIIPWKYGFIWSTKNVYAALACLWRFYRILMAPLFMVQLAWLWLDYGVIGMIKTLLYTFFPFASLLRPHWLIHQLTAMWTKELAVENTERSGKKTVPAFLFGVFRFLIKEIWAS